MQTVLDGCNSASDSDAFFTWASEEFLLREQVSPWTELPLWLPEEAAPQLRGFMFVSCDKAVAGGLRTRPLNDTIRDTLSWFQANRVNEELKAGLATEKEQALLRKWHETRSHQHVAS